MLFITSASQLACSKCHHHTWCHSAATCSSCSRLFGCTGTCNVCLNMDTCVCTACFIQGLCKTSNGCVQGIIDAHVHLLEGGYALQQVDLTDIRSPAEFTKRLQQACGGAYHCNAPSCSPTCELPMVLMYQLAHDAIANATAPSVMHTEAALAKGSASNAGRTAVSTSSSKADRAR